MSEENTVIIGGIEYVPKSENKPKEFAFEEHEICMVRTYSAGVFYGKLANQNGKCGTVKNARRVHSWSGAASLSELAQRGSSNVSGCRMPMHVTEVRLTEIIEVIPMTKEAYDNLESVEIWTK